jgi:hypothetical protein
VVMVGWHCPTHHRVKRGPGRGAGAPKGEVRFARDSPLEGTGFEPSVPRRRPASSWCRFSFAPTFP